VALVLIFWFVAPRLGDKAWLVNVLMIVYVAVVFAGWLRMGAPNPRGLGYISKGIELVLVLALLAHAWTLIGRSRMAHPVSV
jgi:hypothetical protein